MKALEDCCNDCPTREIMPDIANMMQYIIDNYPEIAREVTIKGLSPMYAAVAVIKKLEEASK